MSIISSWCPRNKQYFVISVYVWNEPDNDMNDMYINKIIFYDIVIYYFFKIDKFFWIFLLNKLFIDRFISI